MISFSKSPVRFFRKFVLAITAVLIAATGCIQRDPDDDVDGRTYEFEVHFIYVGQGDAILVRTPSKTMLIDAGPRDGNAASYLHSVGVSEIDVVIATHPHADHIGGMPEIFGSFPVREIIDPGIAHSTLTYTRYLELIDELDIPYSEGRKGMRIDLCTDAFAEIIHPATPDEESLNDASIVLMLVLGDIRMLLTGDIEKRSEEQLVEWHGDVTTGLRSHIFKVPHHGSFSSSHTEFLEAVSPELSIIMCGLHNPHGNPHRRTLAALEAAGSDILRTDLNGHIILRTDGEDYVVDVERDGPPLPSLINLNTASLEELQHIVHIGPSRAGQIIRLRPFLSVDDLIRVDGIGPARLADIKRQNIVVTE